jgi:hypothetical protein
MSAAEPDRPPIVMDGDDLSGAELRGVRLRGARFRGVDLSDAQMRGVWLAGADIDGDLEDMRIWGIEVRPLLEAELDRRHPERTVFHATEPADLLTGLVTGDELTVECTDPWGGDWSPTVLQCLRVIFEEEWQHHRYATRDLAAIATA